MIAYRGPNSPAGCVVQIMVLTFLETLLLGWLKNIDMRLIAGILVIEAIAFIILAILTDKYLS